MMVVGVLLVFIGSVLSVGCEALRSADVPCQIGVANRSGKDVSAVAIDVDGMAYRIGFLAYTPTGSSTAGGCQLRFWDGFAVGWSEDGLARKVTVDVQKYRAKRQHIGSMAFYYHGSDVWEVVAQEGAGAGSAVIHP